MLENYSVVICTSIFVTGITIGYCARIKHASIIATTAVVACYVFCGNPISVLTAELMPVSTSESKPTPGLRFIPLLHEPYFYW
jgi:hypothetical protein